MKKPIVCLLLLLAIFCSPALGEGKPYSLERLFNQPDMEESLNAHLSLYLTKLNRDIDAIFDFRDIVLASINEFLSGKNDNREMAFEAYRQYLATSILLAAILDKEGIELDQGLIDQNAVNMKRLYLKLNDVGLIGGDLDKFMYMYNQTLNYFAPKLIRRL